MLRSPTVGIYTSVTDEYLELILEMLILGKYFGIPLEKIIFKVAIKSFS